MTFVLSTLVTALALATDAVAVSIVAGLSNGRARVRDALLVATFFGGFQAGMPLLGALIGGAVRPFVEHAAPILAGVVLIGLGGYAVRQTPSNEEESAPVDFFDMRVLFGLAVATSIDAFAVGVSISLASTPLVPSVVIIGVVTFVLSFAAVIFATRFERLFGSKAELVGGLALIALGTSIVMRAAAKLV